MAMRFDCKHYESRTYPSGDTVRRCRLDLAPDAPWRCPEDCSRYERRTVDVGWNYGSLRDAVSSTAEPPPSMDDDVVALLAETESILDEAGQELRDELAKPRRRKLFRRRKKRS